MPPAHPQTTLEDPFVDMPAMPSPTRRSGPSTSRSPVNPFALSAPLLQLQPPSPDTPHPPELLPPPVIHANTSPSSSSRPDSPSGSIRALWTPDSPSAAHPNLPPPPAYESPLSRTRTRSNEDPTGPFADAHSLHSLSSDGSASPPRRADDRKFGSAKGRGFVVLNGSTPSFLEAGDGGGKVPAMASEDAASRRRRNQKIKWGSMAGAGCLVFVLLVALAVGVGIGVVKAT